MRDAVAATGLRFEELDEQRAVDLGCVSAVNRLYRGGRLSRQELLCRAAARSGNLEQLKEFRENNTPWDERTCFSAAHGGHLEVLQWAHANGCPWNDCPLNMGTCAGAALGGHLEVLQWAHANGCPWNEETCSWAAWGGHFEVLQWARANGCPWNRRTCSYAAAGGHLEMLQWARANGAPWDADTCCWAAGGGHLEMLQWLRANGCPWNERTCKEAEDKHHRDVFFWAHAKGCTMSDRTRLLAIRKEWLAQEAIPRLPDPLVVTHILRSEYFDDPADLARLPAVSRAMREAVAATGLRFKELDEKRAVNLGCVSAVNRLYREVACRVKNSYVGQRRGVDISKS